MKIQLHRNRDWSNRNCWMYMEKLTVVVAVAVVACCAEYGKVFETTAAVGDAGASNVAAAGTTGVGSSGCQPARHRNFCHSSAALHLCSPADA